MRSRRRHLKLMFGLVAPLLAAGVILHVIGSNTIGWGVWSAGLVVMLFLVITQARA